MDGCHGRRPDPSRAGLAAGLRRAGGPLPHRRELLGDPDGGAAAADAARDLEGPKVRALLAGQRADGGFGVRPYSKWTGAHWRLVSLVELAAPAGEPRAEDALDVLVRRRRPDGRWRPGGAWWRAPGARPGSGPPEVVDWGRSGPNELLTLNALRVLRAAGNPGLHRQGPGQVNGCCSS